MYSWQEDDGNSCRVRSIGTCPQGLGVGQLMLKTLVSMGIVYACLLTVSLWALNVAGVNDAVSLCTVSSVINKASHCTL